MPTKRVQFEGTVHEFPDDFTDADIAEALASHAPTATPQPGSHPSLIDRAVDALPTIGGTVGGIVGGLGGTAFGFGFGGVPGAVGGASLGAGGGEAAKQLIHRIRGQAAPGTMGEAARGVGTEAAINGGLEAAGGAAGAGLRIAGKAAYRGGVALLPATIKREFPHLAESGLREGVSLTRRGMAKADRLTGESADAADALIAQRSGERPLVRGYLPEGRTPVPLGAPPVPAGGAGATPRARLIQIRKIGPIGNAEDLLQRTWTPAYGGAAADAAAEAVPDVVQGAGTVLRPMNAAPGSGRVPNMISLDDALAHVPALAKEIGTGKMGANEPALGQVRRIVANMADGRQWPIPLLEAQAMKRTEQDAANNAYRALDRGTKTKISTSDRMAQGIAKGLREALERAVPDVGPLNARTQELVGLSRAAEKSANTGHVLSRLIAASVMGGMAGPAGVIPAAGSALVGGALATPAGLTRTGLALKGPAAYAAQRVLPPAVRAALITRMLAAHKPEDQ